MWQRGPVRPMAAPSPAVQSRGARSRPSRIKSRTKSVRELVLTAGEQVAHHLVHVRMGVRGQTVQEAPGQVCAIAKILRKDSLLLGEPEDVAVEREEALPGHPGGESAFLSVPTSAS